MKKLSMETYLILILIGLAAGILSGLIGVGGGIIMVPALVFFLGMSQLEAQGTSIAIMLPPVGALAAYNYYKAGALNIHYAIIIAIFFVLGAYFGSRLSIYVISESLLKKIFGAVMMFVAIKLIFFSK